MKHRDFADELLLAPVAEGRVTVFSGVAEDLLAEIEGANAVTGESLRSEAVRLFALCHDIVRLLALGDIEGAHRVSVRNAEQGGDVLGLAV